MYIEIKTKGYDVIDVYVSPSFQKTGVKKHPSNATHFLELFLLGPTAHVQFFVPLEFCFSRFSAD